MNNNVTEINNSVPYLKERGNDHFNIHTNNSKMLKMLAEKGYVKEINNILFILDNETELWVVANTDFAWLGIREFMDNRHPRFWTLLKMKKGFTGKYKPTAKILPNTFEINRDQVISMIQAIQNNNLTFSQLYSYVQPQFNLNNYILGD